MYNLEKINVEDLNDDFLRYLLSKDLVEIYKFIFKLLESYELGATNNRSPDQIKIEKFLAKRELFKFRDNIVSLVSSVDENESCDKKSKDYIAAYIAYILESDYKDEDDLKRLEELKDRYYVF